MLALVRNHFRSRQSAIFALLLFGCGLLASCATKQEPQLISDSSSRESALPWNKQEKWEGTGQLGAMAERFGSDRR